MDRSFQDRLHVPFSVEDSNDFYRALFATVDDEEIEKRREPAKKLEALRSTSLRVTRLF